jgi:hypothetical protein
MKLHPIRVHTYSGYKADERPLKFEHEWKEHMIREIVGSRKNNLTIYRAQV